MTDKGRLRILSLSSSYPRADNPAFGVFVRERLQAMAAGADIRVLSPDWVVPFRRKSKAPGGAALRGRTDGEVEVFYPQWYCLPFESSFNGVLLFLQLLPVVFRLRREFPFGMLDAHWGNLEGVAAALLGACLRKPFSVTLRGMELRHSQYRLRRRVMSWAWRRAACVIALSDELGRLATDLGVSPERLTVISNGVDTGIFSPQPKEEVRLQLGLARGHKVVLSAGRLVEVKGHHRTIEAMGEMLRTDESIRLFIASSQHGSVSAYQDRLRSLAGDPGFGGRVHFLGEIPQCELSKWMSAADVFCLASSREGCPNVVREAIACGTPVVATDVGAVRDLIPSIQYGIVVPTHEQSALTEALGAALDRTWDRAEIARWGGSRSWSNVAREVLHRFKDVAPSNPG